MFKIQFSILLLLLLSLGLNAQNTPNISIGTELGLPSGNFANVSGVGVGASLKADFPISTDFAITLNGGYMNFFGKRTYLQQVNDLTYLPVKAGLKYQLSESFYAEGQLGAGFALNDGQKTVFVFSPGFGNKFKLSGKNRLDLGVRYEAWMGKNNQGVVLSNSTNIKGFLGIRFAYILGFN